MATSRRRERELARRRYERRRLREQQLRARRRRRNTILGAGLGTVAVIIVIVVLAMNLGGGGTSTVDTAKGPTPSTSSTPPVRNPSLCAPIRPNPPVKGAPFVPPVHGKPPTGLQIKDMKRGTGKVAKKGSKLTVNYVGVGCSNGVSFDASYGKQPFQLTLGAGQVIKGWDQGLVGMRAGGRRELVIPSTLGYGPTETGTGPHQIAANETLIFVVDLLKVS